MGELFSIGRSLFAASEGGHHGPSYEGLFLYVAIVIAVLFGFLTVAKSGLKDRVFVKWPTQWLEQLYLFIENMCVGIIGAHGRKYVPMIMTFWCLIFVSNIVSLFFPTAPTADLSFNLALALISIGYVQYEGIKANGLFGHLSHFAGPKLGIGLIAITGMIFIIEIISELMKNVSLSLRLFGNIHGGHQAVESMNQLVPYVPMGFFLLPIKLLTCVVQAMIFSLLTCVYLSLVTAHHDDHEHDHDGHGEPAAAH